MFLNICWWTKRVWIQKISVLLRDRRRVHISLDIENLSFPNKTMPFEVPRMLQNIGREKTQMFRNIRWCTKRAYIQKYSVLLEI